MPRRVPAAVHSANRVRSGAVAAQLDRQPAVDLGVAGEQRRRGGGFAQQFHRRQRRTRGRWPRARGSAARCHPGARARRARRRPASRKRVRVSRSCVGWSVMVGLGAWAMRRRCGIRIMRAAAQSDESVVIRWGRGSASASTTGIDMQAEPRAGAVAGCAGCWCCRCCSCWRRCCRCWCCASSIRRSRRSWRRASVRRGRGRLALPRRLRLARPRRHGAEHCRWRWSPPRTRTSPSTTASTSRRSRRRASNNARGRKVRGASTISQQVGEEPVPVERPQLGAQGRRGLVHGADRDAVAQAPDPGDVRQHRRVRRRHLRRAGGGAQLLPQGCRAADAGRERAPGGGAAQSRSATTPRARGRTCSGAARDPAADALHRRRGLPRRFD